MSQYATSADGTRIAFDRLGDGPAVIMVAAAMQFRAFDPATVALSAALADEGFTVINYDRRGRGESPATSLGLSRDLDDIRALIDVAGGSAALFGSSSGAAIALAAASAGLPATKLALWEAPLSRAGGAEFLAGLRVRIAAGDGDATQAYFMKDMPPQWLEGAKNSPAWPVMTAMSASLEGDAEALAWAQSAPPAELFSRISQPTLVLVGEQPLPIFEAAADTLGTHLPHATVRQIAGANHSWDQAAIVAELAGFLRPEAPRSTT
ncbi:alpha/beta hydrolase [Salinibacterium sp. G-O1]|uniref:alpha/beta fold hydrolase n=1 Tax=Salinibacterium sp. G-O1 TaxID=3046208 RepID=UPI0024BA37AA|nr:alpha/beta hydrolase [Salinibacterium sp. G-O1]MDJ0333852.1 alpha/beta hydrolase [Salinibacterium sp. G-O1]